MSEHATTCDCSKCYPPGTPRPAWLSTFNPADIAATVLLYGAAPPDYSWPPFNPFDIPQQPFRPPPPQNCGVPGCHVCSGAMRERAAKGDP